MAPVLQLPSISAGVTTSAGLGLLGLGDSPLGCSVLFPAGAVLGVPAIKPLSQAECCSRGRWPRGVDSECGDGLGAGCCCPVPKLGTRWGQCCSRHELCWQHEAERSWLCCWLCPGSAGHVGTQLVLIKGLSARREDVAVIRAGGEGCFALSGSTSESLPWQQPLPASPRWHGAGTGLWRGWDGVSLRNPSGPFF